MTHDPDDSNFSHSHHDSTPSGPSPDSIDQPDGGITVALVTGAASGIGRAVADRLFADGHTVCGLDLAATVPDRHARRSSVVADVADQSSVDRAVSGLVERYGGLDIVVNCAGIGAVGSVIENDDEVWHRTFDVNVVGIVRTTRAAHAHLVRSTRASIVNISSIASTAGLPLRAAYSASKGAVDALTRAMAADGIADRIRVNAVSPGTADTPWVGRLLDAAPDPDSARRQLEQRQPMGRLCRPEEVAAAVSYLAGQGAAFTTGTIIGVDGGMSGLRLPPSPTRV